MTRGRGNLRFPCWFARALAASALLAFGLAGAQGQSMPPVVRARVVLATDRAHPASLVRAAVIAQIAPGFHINAHHPSFSYLIPTQARFTSSPLARVEKITYPVGRPMHFDFSQKPLSVYEGRLVIGMEVRIGRAAPSTILPVRGTLSYQACNDHACFPPTSVPLAFKISIVAASVPLHSAHARIFSKIKSP